MKRKAGKAIKIKIIKARLLGQKPDQYLEVKGLGFTIHSDNRGKFIAYCHFWPHRGIIANGEHTICEKRGCADYRKLYLPEKDSIETKIYLSNAHRPFSSL